MRGFGREPEGRRPIGRCKHRWDNDITIDLKGTGYEVMDWILLAQDVCKWWAVVQTLMNF
jgi:hypothetical protein